ncbi:CR2 protein, partial [Acrocephalus arundinaceus]|nr:CR2 protein [Acrocephalus arundinaceus]
LAPHSLTELIPHLPLAVRPCPMPPKVANGNHNDQDKAFFTAGMSVRYTCNPGYYLVGNAAVSCRASGKWSQPRPRCEAVKCSQPPNITHGRLQGNASATFPLGAAVSYSCNPGYSLVGNAFINCTGSGSWSQPLPQCKGDS